MGLCLGVARAAGGTIVGGVATAVPLVATAAIGSALTSVVTMLGQKVMDDFQQGQNNHLGFQEVFKPMLAGGLTLAIGTGCLGALFGLLGGFIQGCSSERGREDSRV